MGWHTYFMNSLEVKRNLVNTFIYSIAKTLTPKKHKP